MFYEVVSGGRFRRFSWPRKKRKTITTETKFPDRFRIVSGTNHGNDQGKWKAPIYIYIYKKQIYIYIHIYSGTRTDQAWPGAFQCRKPAPERTNQHKITPYLGVISLRFLYL